MAELRELTRLIPDDPKFDVLRQTLDLMEAYFPKKVDAVNPAHIEKWVDEIDSGAVSGAKKRQDILQYIVGEGTIRNTFKIDAKTAQSLIRGDVTFRDFLAERGETGTPDKPTDPDVPPLTILKSASLTWFRDSKTGNYYARYTLPNTNQFALFEVEDEQLTALFGKNPPPAQRADVSRLMARSDYHFAGNVAEVEGEGVWETEVADVIDLALDRENLPDWIQNDPQAMGLFWLKVTDERSDDWFYEQISSLTSFKRRYPGIEKLTGMGLSVGESVSAFTEMEVSVKQLHAAAGYHPDAITPAIIGGLLGRGYSVNQIQQSYASWKRMNDNAPALSAFNQILVAQGKKPLKGTDMYKFLNGTAPAEVYDIYEASAIREAARATGFDKIFDARDSLSLALSTAEDLTPNQAYAQFSQVAAQALRFRHELDVSAFGLEIDDLIDVSFGRKPRSGKTVADIGESLAKATAAAEASLGRRVQPFTGFTPDGRPQQRSLSGARTQY